MLWKNFGLVKGVQFNSWRRVGSVHPAVKVYNSRDVDELMLLDIAASIENHEPDFESVREYALECTVPFTVGGGITVVKNVLDLLHAGADKVCINTAIFNEYPIIEKVAEQFGSQCVVASIDARLMENGNHICFSHAATVNTGMDPADWARRLEGSGAGEILLTSIDRDGTMEGYDLRLVETVVNAVKIPVIAAGGAGSYLHMIDVVQKSGASAVAAASIFHFTEHTPAGARLAMAAAGIPVRSPQIMYT
jgi:cyclase